MMEFLSLGFRRFWQFFGFCMSDGKPLSQICLIMFEIESSMRSNVLAINCYYSVSYEKLHVTKFQYILES